MDSKNIPPSYNFFPITSTNVAIETIVIAEFNDFSEIFFRNVFIKRITGSLLFSVPNDWKKKIWTVPRQKRKCQ